MPRSTFVFLIHKNTRLRDVENLTLLRNATMVMNANFGITKKKQGAIIMTSLNT